MSGRRAGLLARSTMLIRRSLSRSSSKSFSRSCSVSPFAATKRPMNVDQCWRAFMSHRVVSESEWVQARKHHLAREKELLRQLDELRRQRRELPWVRIENPYSFQSVTGT